MLLSFYHNGYLAKRKVSILFIQNRKQSLSLKLSEIFPIEVDYKSVVPGQSRFLRFLTFDFTVRTKDTLTLDNSIH